MTEPSAHPHARERLLGVLLFIAGDVMFWAALLGASLVVRSGDPTVFDGHRTAMADTLYSWLVLPALVVALAGLGLRLALRTRRWPALVAALACLVPPLALAATLGVWGRTTTQLVELDGVRYAVDVKPFAPPGGNVGRFAQVAPSDWTPAEPLPGTAGIGGELRERILRDGRLVAEVRDGPSRHAFFGIAWVAAAALVVHWLLAALLLFLRDPVSVAAVWGGWTAALSLGLLLALL